MARSCSQCGKIQASPSPGACNADPCEDCTRSDVASNEETRADWQTDPDGWKDELSGTTDSD